MNSPRYLTEYDASLPPLKLQDPAADADAHAESLRRIRHARLWGAIQLSIAAITLGYAAWDGVTKWGGFVGGVSFIVALDTGAIVGWAAMVSHDRADRLADRYEESTE